jgi:tetratricopeptide (TPR) repeat protein
MTGDAGRFEGRATGREARGTGERVGALAGRVGPVLGGFVLPFALLLYLGLEGGGYGVGLEGADPGATNGAILRSEVAIAAWWLLLLGSLAAALPFARIGRAAWVAIGLFSAYAAWTGLSMLWSDSPERSFDEFTRVLAYLGVFALAIAVQRRGGLRRMVGAVAAAIAVLGILALLSRLHPAWFPVDEAAQQLANVRTRLNYPLDYWNGLAALIGIGLVPLLGLAIHGRHVVTQALATAAIPVLSLVGFYTVSRSAPVIAAAALAVFLLLHPRRRTTLIPLALGVTGSVLAVGAASQRDALESNLGNTLAHAQGDEMLVIMALICTGVGLLRAATGLTERYDAGRLGTTLRAVIVAGGLAGVVAIAAALAANLPPPPGEIWDEFKAGGSPTETTERFSSASGNGRYQYWESAVDQNATSRLEGTGAGTFELWWQQHGEIRGAIRDAHSLYFETFGELGLVGLVLLLCTLASILVAGARHAMAAPPSRRALLAAAAAGCTAFVLAMGIDWGWEIAVLPTAFVLLAAPLVAHPKPAAEAASDRRSRALAGRIAVALASAFAMVASGLTLFATKAIEDSQAAARAGDYEQALDDANRAADLQPWAAAPLLQRALVYEEQGDLDAAAPSAGAAQLKEPSNWEHLVTQARIQQKVGQEDAAIQLVLQAKGLYPTYLGFANEPLPEETGIDYEPAQQP